MENSSKPGFTEMIHVRALVPSLAKLANLLSIFSATIVTAIALYKVHEQEETVLKWAFRFTGQSPEPYILWGFCIALGFAALLLFRYALATVLSLRKKVTITETQIQFCKWGFVRTFDRTLPTRFVLEAHPKADEERECHAYLENKARLKGKARRPKKYYQNAQLLCLEHVGISHPIVAIYPARNAKYWHSRLNAAVALIDGKSRNGKGVATSASEEWQPQAGRLPE